MNWLILTLGIVCNAFASVLLKLAVTPPRRFPSLSAPAEALQNPPFWGGLVLYGLAFLLYASALTRLPLNIAHPIMTCGAVALVAILSVLLFKETFYWTTITGVVLVIVGVALITVRTP